MTQRERTMIGVVGGAAALFGAYRLVVSQVTRPLNDLRQQIDDRALTVAKLESELTAEPIAHAGWQEESHRTLGGKPEDALLEFRRDLETLLDRHGLRDNRTTKTRQPSAIRKGFRTGFTELTVSISVNGTLEGLVGFLRDLSYRPYLARVARLSIASSESDRAERSTERSTSRRGRSSGGASTTTASPDQSPRLTIRMTATALLLPQAIKGVANRALTPEELADPAHASRSDDAAERYSPIAKVNIFKKYREPPPVAQAPSEPPKVDTPRNDSGRRPTPRPPETSLKLVSTIGYNNEPTAYLRDEHKKHEPLRVVRLNDSIEDGKLVLIHPTGVVIRVPNSGGADGHTDYFLPVGAQFRERTPLDPTAQPEVARELEMAFRPSGS
jgi:hypothetical protein